jgi:hypothetical protein
MDGKLRGPETPAAAMDRAPRGWRSLSRTYQDNYKMNPRISLLFLLAAMVAVPGQTSRAQIGVLAGMNFENVSDVKLTSASGTFDSKTGWHAGIFYNLPLGPIALRPAVLYRDAGTLTLNATAPGQTVDSFELSMIEVPVDVIVGFGTVVRPYITAGPVFHFNNTSTDAVKDDVKGTTVSANVGAGIELDLLGLKVMPEARYAFGLSALFDEQIAGISLEESVKHNVFMLRLNVAI